MLKETILEAVRVFINVFGVGLLGFCTIPYIAILVEAILDIKESKRTRGIVEIVEVGGAQYYKDTYGRIHPYEE